MKRFFTFPPFTMFPSLLGFIFLIFFSSCQKEKVILEHSFEIPEQNWDFNQRVLSFEGEITAMPEACMVVVDVEHENLWGYPTIPISLSILSPDGSESVRSSGLIFNKEYALNETTIRAIVYPEKYFNTSGTYKLSLYRYHEKFDFYGIKKVSIKVIKKPVK